MTENIGLPGAVQTELAAMRDVIGLVAFAVEARRVLAAIDMVADEIPHIGDTLSKVIGQKGGCLGRTKAGGDHQSRDRGR